MSKWPASWRVILLFVFCCILSGCMPIGEAPVDEEKDPNYIEGRNQVKMRDYAGAIQCFERAVQTNPRNAAAHFELAVLYEENMKDPLTAAYHYKKHLELRPKSEYLQAARDRLEGCKMDIAKTVRIVVVNEQVHKDLARLTNELSATRLLNDQLRVQLAAKPTVVTQYLKYIMTNNVPVYIQPTNQPQTAYRAPTNTTTQTPRTMATNNTPRVIPLQPAAATNSNTRTMQQRAAVATQTTARPQPARPRTYVVKTGETMAEVARRSGVTLQKLQAANPTIEPKRLKAGQTLNIPSQ